jgi:signal transduction histidine kinase
MMGRLSLRARTTLLTVVVFALAAAAAGFLLISVMYDSLIDEVDRSIEDRAADIAAQVISDNEEIVLGADAMAVVYSTDGSIFDATDLDIEIDGLLETVDGYGQPTDVSLPAAVTRDADNLRAMAIVVDFGVWVDGGVPDSSEPVGPLAPDDFIIYVGTSLDGVDRTVDAATKGVLIVGPTLIGVVGLLTWLFASRALRPVAAIRAEVDDINASGLHRRVPQPRSGDEIARLATTMNGMLARLEAASGRQRQFVSDASHELRSPLASMQARLDVAIRHGDFEGWQGTAESLRSDVLRMHRLVEDLLLLARANDGEVEGLPVQGLVDLDDVVFDVLAATEQPIGVHIDTSMVSAGLVGGHHDSLRRIVQNLIDNALRYASALITVQLVEESGPEGSGTVVLLIDDDGSGIEPDQRDRVFERFVRLDDARARDSGGSGLGLAISREIARSHGGSLTLTDAPGGGARFELVLPAAQR